MAGNEKGKMTYPDGRIEEGKWKLGIYAGNQNPNDSTKMSSKP